MTHRELHNKSVGESFREDNDFEKAISHDRPANEQFYTSGGSGSGSEVSGLHRSFDYGDRKNE